MEDSSSGATAGKRMSPKRTIHSTSKEFPNKKPEATYGGST